MAVAIGSAAALLSLLSHAPVRVACLRGGIAWFCVLLVGKSVAWLLDRMASLEAQREARRVAELALDEEEGNEAKGAAA